MRLIVLLCITLFVLVSVPVHSAASAIATVTQLDGNGSAISGTRRYTLVEGNRLNAGDIVELDEHSSAQIEFAEGTVVALGGESRAMLFPGQQGKVELFMLRGVAKIQVGKGSIPVRLDSSRFYMDVADSTAVLLLSPNEAHVFVEVGEVTLVDEGAQTTVEGGQYWSFKAGLSKVVESSPPQSFVAAIPVAFRDALPNLLPNFRKHIVPLADPHEFSYKEVEDWLNSAPQVRSSLVVNWKSKARDPNFRKTMILNISTHPEWKELVMPKPRHRHVRRVKHKKPSTVNQNKMSLNNREQSEEIKRANARVQA